MTSLEAQREARRRKITQNAEARLNRLLGVGQSQAEQTQTVPQTVSSRQSLHENGSDGLRLRSQISSDSSSSALTHSSVPSTIPSQTTNPSSPVPLSSSAKVSTQRHINDVAPSESPLSPRENFSGSEDILKHGDEASEHPLKTLEVSRSSAVVNKAKQLDAAKFEIIKLVSFVAAAVFAGLCRQYGIGLLICHNMFVPFLVVAGMWEYIVCKHLQHLMLASTKGMMVSIMRAVLMLCGIKSELIGMYNTIMAYVNKYVSDLCFYIFSYLVWTIIVS